MPARYFDTQNYFELTFALFMFIGKLIITL